MRNRDGYSDDPRAYGLAPEYWNITAKGRDLLAEAKLHNAAKPGERFAPSDFDYDPIKDPRE